MNDGMSAIGTKQTSNKCIRMSAFGGKADIASGAGKSAFRRVL